MAINITETDNTLYGTRSADSDNIVYIPGSAITGPNTPTLYKSYNEFIKNHGDHGCEGSITWDYVANILLAGFPVLFQRITQTNTLSVSPVELTTKAKLEVKNEADTDIILTIEDLYGGSYGNDLNISLVQEYETIYLRVYLKNKLLETFKVASTSDNAEDEVITERMLTGLLNIESDRIKITIPDESKFEITVFNNLYLKGGEDADEQKVLEEIANNDSKLSIFSVLEDKYIYDIKFIVSGGYIDQDLYIAKSMTNLAESRGDCVAIPDVPINTPKGTANKYFSTINTSYGTSFAPWCYTELATSKSIKKWMPPSFIFLRRLATSVISNGNPIWYPVAGVKRASVSDVVKTEYEIGGAMIDEWQEMNSQALNPILKLRSYGYVIYGQRTMYATDDSNYPSPSALRQLSVRLTVNEIKRAIFNICLGLKFEKNDLYTWNEFCVLLRPLLNAMKSDRGVTDYQLIMNETTTTNEDIQEYRIRGSVKISVLNTVEDFDIGFTLEPSSVTFDNDSIV